MPIIAHIKRLLQLSALPAAAELACPSRHPSCVCLLDDLLSYDIDKDIVCPELEGYRFNVSHPCPHTLRDMLWYQLYLFICETQTIIARGPHWSLSEYSSL